MTCALPRHGEAQAERCPGTGTRQEMPEQAQRRAGRYRMRDLLDTRGDVAVVPESRFNRHSMTCNHFPECLIRFCTKFYGSYVPTEKLILAEAHVGIGDYRLPKASQCLPRNIISFSPRYVLGRPEYITRSFLVLQR